MIMFFKVSVKYIITLIASFAITSSVYAAGTLDWSVQAPLWPNNALNNNYVNIGTPGVDVSVTVTGNTGNFQGTSPNLFNGNLDFFVNWPNATSTITITINFSQAISDLAFNIIDVDAGAFVDQVTINATGPGGAVVPSISPDTTGPVNYTVAGNVITGVLQGDEEPTPVQFNDAVTQIVFIYGNGPGAPANPGTQAIAISDLSWTNEADLVISKNDGSLTYTPGTTGNYILSITNNGPGPVTAANIVDNLPNGVTLSAQWTCSATAGSSCSAANGGSVNGSIVSLTANIINGGVVTVNVPVQFSSDMADY